MSPAAEHGIIVFGSPRFCGPEFAQLAKEYKVKMLGPTPRADAIAKIKEFAEEGGWDAVLFLGGPTGLVNKELLGPLEGKLQYTGGIGAGFDGVDVDWLSEIGVWYANAPTGVADPVATTAVMMILQCTRNASSAEAAIRRGEWRKNFQFIIDTRKFVVGIIGMGTIGKLTRDKCLAFGMRVLYYNRKRLPVEEEKGAEYVSFEELLKQSQCITLHCSLQKDTYHLLGAKEFAMMRKGVYIVNTSRGKVIDEEALVEALKSGQVERAGLDCFEKEPEVHPYIMTCDRCALFPHQAGASEVGIRDKELEMLRNLKEWMRDGKPKDAVNKPVGKVSVLN